MRGCVIFYMGGFRTNPFAAPFRFILRHRLMSISSYFVYFSRLQTDDYLSFVFFQRIIVDMDIIIIMVSY